MLKNSPILQSRPKVLHSALKTHWSDHKRWIAVVAAEGAQAVSRFKEQSLFT